MNHLTLDQKVDQYWKQDKEVDQLLRQAEIIITKNHRLVKQIKKEWN